MPKPLSHNSPILIVGGGTWGASTALHLARRGYDQVTVLDPYAFPSPISAGNDINKIVEAGPLKPRKIADLPLDEYLQSLASAGWLNDPIFKPHYHQTGFVVAASTLSGLAHVRRHELTGDPASYTPLTNTASFRATMPPGVLTGEFPNWRGWWKRSGAGWAHARNAYVAAATEARRLGVHFRAAEVTALLYSTNGDVQGARTADGREYHAHRTILAAGAYSDALLDFRKQLRPTAWTLLHIALTPEEQRQFKDLPVLFNVERGFFMEPDAERGELKICDEHPGYVNFAPDGKGARSVPFARHQVPRDSERRAREFLREAVPRLAERPFSFARICWCADTPDRVFLIDRHPEAPSLVLAVGASGHGFSHIPSVGGFVVDAMEGILEPRLKEAFRWRPETAVGRDWRDTQDRFGGTGKVMEFADVKEWTTIGEREAKL